MRALVTGALGQDGSYLCEQLVAAGHQVYGLTRRPNATSAATLIVGDMLDQESLNAAVAQVEPDVVFNLAAILDPGGGWVSSAPLMTEVTGLGAVRLLEAVRRYAPGNVRVVHASSSAVLEPERYGLYGAAKRLAHDAMAGYRDKVWTANAVLFSHTSPRQDPRFLARNICTAIARGETLTLTDLEPHRDWGYAPDYCEALQVIADGESGDWVVATGDQHPVAEFVQIALSAAGRGWDAVQLVDGPTYTDEIVPTGPSAQDLGWKPRTSFEDMIRELVSAAI